MLFLTTLEAPWQDKMINLQHTVNELSLYTICVGIILTSGLSSELIANSMVGWTLVGAVSATMIFNFLIMSFKTV